MNSLSPSHKNSHSFSFDIVSPATVDHVISVKELVWEYFCWGNSLSIREKGFDFNIQQMFLDFVVSLNHYQQPDGILYLLRSGTAPVGTGGFKKICNESCELKRMYIRESYRKTGLGSRLLQMLIEHARTCGYQTMKLETARFMNDACSLYKKYGFKEIPVYSQVESPEEFRSIIFCMELDLQERKMSLI